MLEANFGKPVDHNEIISPRLLKDGEGSWSKNAVVREAQVVLGGIATGAIENASQDIGNHPLQFAVETLAPVGVFIIAARSPAWSRMAGKMAAAAGTFALGMQAWQGIDASMPAIEDTWTSDKNAAQNMASIEEHLGPVGFNLSVMGLMSMGGMFLGKSLPKKPAVAATESSVASVSAAATPITVVDRSNTGLKISPWTERTPTEKRYPTLMGTQQADVAIVGGGIAGSVIADALARKGVGRIIILDGGRVAGLTTGQMAGINTVAVDASVADLKVHLGQENTTQLLQMLRRGTGRIRSLATPINSGYEDATSYWLSYKPNDPTLRRDFEVLGPLDPDSHLVTGKEAQVLAKKIGFRPMQEAVVLAHEGSLDSRRLMTGLLEQESHGGVRIFEDSEVNAVRVTDKVELTTAHGKVIADKVVVATGSLMPAVGQMPGHDVRVYALSAILGEYAPALPKATNFFDTEAPLNFYRRIAKGEILFGGGDAPVEEPIVTSKDKLGTMLSKLFPGSKVTRQWWGIIHETPDGMPYIGELPQSNGKLYAATNFGGTGLVFSGVAGEIMPDLLAGKRSANAQFFSLSRPGLQH